MDFEISEEQLNRLVQEAVDAQLNTPGKRSPNLDEEPSLLVDILNKVFNLEDVW